MGDSVNPVYRNYIKRCGYKVPETYPETDPRNIPPKSGRKSRTIWFGNDAWRAALFVFVLLIVEC